MHVLLRGDVQPRHRCFAASTSTPSPRSWPRAGDWRVDNAETIDRMFYGASVFDQDLGWCTLATVDQAFLTSPCQSNDCVLPCPSFPFLCLFSVAVTLRRRPWRGAYGHASDERNTPKRHRRGLTASRTRAGGVLRGVRVEDPGALGACVPEKTPAPTPDPEGRVCNGGPYDGRRCQNHGFCQQPDPNQPDLDACDDCKCITRKDSDGAGRTSAGGCFFVFVLGVLFGVS